MQLLSPAVIPLVEVSVASAATTDLGAAKSRGVFITGATTITSFGAAPFREVLIRFAGALTLTHNATSLALPGGANIVTAAGDTAVAISDASGNWRVQTYVRAAAEAGWISYTPSISGPSGALTSYTVAGTYKVIGKTVWFRVKITVPQSGKGNAAGSLYVGLPFPNKDHTTAYGKETTSSGSMLSVEIQPNQSALVLNNYDNQFPLLGAGPWTVLIAGTYETT